VKAFCYPRDRYNWGQILGAWQCISQLTTTQSLGQKFTAPTVGRLQSGRRWRQWEDNWFRQHTHPDGIRFEIHEELDRLHTQGFRATQVIVAERYRELISTFLERTTPWRAEDAKHRLYGLPVDFSGSEENDGRWSVINFELVKEPGQPLKYPYFRLFD
jgi:uncharacterized protein (TIGR02652 family)